MPEVLEEGEVTHPTIISISLRLPSKACHPNARPHYMAKANAKKKDRQTACYVALEAMKGQTFGWKSAVAQLTFTTARQNDADNLLAWAKHFIDGIADAGIVTNDRDITYPPVRNVTGKPTGVVITLTKGDA